jgi:hypothetical protein
MRPAVEACFFSSPELQEDRSFVTFLNYLAGRALFSFLETLLLSVSLAEAAQDDLAQIIPEQVTQLTYSGGLGL